MNCRDIESLILAERNGKLSPAELAVLSDHVATCAACRHLQARLNQALQDYHQGVSEVATPDVAAAWHDLRTRIHQPARRNPLAPVIWFGAPLAAAAAIAFAFFANHSPQPFEFNRQDPVETARADFVEAGDTNASTMVYVDKDSGWLVVWASDVDTKTSG